MGYIEFTDKDALHKNVCKNIKRFRKEKNHTQQELAEMIGISFDYVRRLESEKGKKDFSFYTLYKISKVLSVPLDDFLA